METEDGRIIQECLNGEKEAFGVLIDKYREGIYAYIYVKIGDFQDAQDITQEVFLKAYQGLRSLKRWESFAFWLYRIAYSRCGQWQRDRAKRVDRDFIEDQSPKAMDSPSLNSYRDEQLNESVRETLDLLPEAYREVLVLHYFAGMSSDEMAVSLGTSPTAIRMRLSRARGLLKEEIIEMMSRTFEEQRLPMGFTFRVVEAVKRIKIHPATPESSGLPWGLSLATGIIITILSLNPYLSISNDISDPSGAPLPIETKVLKTGEIPVDIIKIDEVSIISSKYDNDKNAEIYNPKNVLLSALHGEGNIWTKKNNMPTTKGAHSSSVVNDKIYVIGGCKAFPDPLSTVEEYDPATDTWTKKADMPTARNVMAASALDGKIYAIGGWNWGGVSSVVEEYDPEKDKWIRKADMQLARDGLAASSVNGKIYAIGGGVVGQVLLDPTQAVEEYDLITDTWTRKADMPTSRHSLVASAVNGKIYAIGGRIGLGQEGPPLATVEEYDPITDTWTRKADMPTPRWYPAISVVDNRIYVIGGSINEASGLSIVEVYDPVTDTWEKKANMPTPRWYFSTNAINGKIYAIGGAIAAWTYTSAVEEYDTGFISGEAIKAKGKLSTTWGETKSR